MLADYREPSKQLSIARAPAAPTTALQALMELVRHWSSGWRSLDRYASTGDPLGLLSGGRGVLLEGPATLVERAERILFEQGTNPTVVGANPRREELQALCLGQNFVVARHFEFEVLNASAAGAGHGRRPHTRQRAHLVNGKKGSCP